MAFTTMHFAVGMAGAGAAASVAALVLRRGWRWVPLLMTAGGAWACVPDMPRIFKEDFPNAPFAAALSAGPLQQWLQTHGDWFFMHRSLDLQPKEYALHGLAGILLMYTVACFVFAVRSRRPVIGLQADEDANDTKAAEAPAPRRAA